LGGEVGGSWGRAPQGIPAIFRRMATAPGRYRHPARVTAIIARRQSELPESVRGLIAWKAQLRLAGRYRRLNALHLHHNKIVVALARELSGFVRAIARTVKLVQALPQAH